MAFLIPLLVVMMAGWWIPMQLLLQATARLRHGSSAEEA
jgi:hypothetical protein